MADGEENQDLVAMKKLLNSWHVGTLYELFKEEDITINELKMMQYSHINALLSDCKMGVIIRFEYHFKNWRNKIGMPLKSTQHGHAMCFCNFKANTGNSCSANDHIRNTAANNRNSIPAKRRRFKDNAEANDQIELDENHVPLSPQSVNSNTSLFNMLNSNEIVNIMPMPMMDSPTDKTHNNDDESESENIPLNTLSDLLSESVNESPPKFPSKPTGEKCPINLTKILQMTGARGRAILKFYHEKNHLTNVHRSELIQNIVDYFVENDYHLSLNMSHNLEWEILKMFPTEKLEYYRTEKRGKIYVKFSNTKRYKRNNRGRTEIESLSVRPRRSQHMKASNEKNNAVKEESDNVDGGNTDEDWYLATEPEIMVKEENSSMNDQYTD